MTENQEIKKENYITIPLHHILIANGYKYNEEENSIYYPTFKDKDNNNLIRIALENGHYLYRNLQKSEDKGNIWNFCTNRKLIAQDLIRKYNEYKKDPNLANALQEIPNIIQIPLHHILIANGYEYDETNSSEKPTLKDKSNNNLIQISLQSNGHYLYRNLQKSEDKGNIWNFCTNRKLIAQDLVIKYENSNKSPETLNVNKYKTANYIPLNQILYGPPGTGKTYSTIEKALDILDISYGANREEMKKKFDDYKQKGQIEFITFHQSFSYEDFIEGIAPVLEDTQGDIKYEIKDGIFKEVCQRARDNSAKPYILIIDEINRGNVSKIFGELITLLEEDKRDGEKESLSATLPYSKKSFSIPSNLYIIGTMNTADRNITALDTALRRRFSFVEMIPKPEILQNIDGIDLKEMLKAINDRIEYLYDREKSIGHAYFMDVDSVENLKKIFRDKIIPLLQEYFYDDYEQINAVLNDNGMIEVKESKENPNLESLKNIIDNEKKIYKISSSDKWTKEQFTKIYS